MVSIDKVAESAQKMSNSSDSSSNTEDADPTDAGSFQNFPMSEDVVTKLRARGITKLFPVQVSTFRPIYKNKDVITQARTGSGKTLSFVLPTLTRLVKNGISTERGRYTSVICLAPTRELAGQIYEDFLSVVDKKQVNVDKFYGGQAYEPQETAIRRGMDILVGTPGRILDLCDKGKLILNQVKHVILDEADRMLEIGFKDHIDQILAYCTKDNKPQMCLFSATMPSWVSQVANTYMTKPKTINMIADCRNKTSATVNHLAIRCLWQNRADIIGDIVQQYSGRHGRAIVFTQTKVQANELSVSDSITLDAQVLHGDIPQKQRELRLQGFREGKFQCLVATDVAARGLDIPEIDLVIQCEPPKDVDSYIHRSGRTGRAGREGTCVCLYDSKKEFALKEVERQAGIKFKRVSPPQPHQLIQSAVSDATRCLDDVPAKVLPAFTKHAKELLSTRPAEDIIAAALSYISGLTEIKKRSVLSSEQGYTAYQMSNTFEVRSPYFFWNTLETQLGQSFRADVKFMKLTKDKMGCVIDVPEKYEEYIEDTWVDNKVKLFKMTDLPELEDYQPRYGGGNTGNYNRGNRSGGYNSYNNNNNNYNNNNRGNFNNTRNNNNNYNTRNSNNNYNSQNNNGFKRRAENPSYSQNGPKRTKY